MANDSGQCGDNVRYALDENGVLTISGAGPMYDLVDIQTRDCNAPWRNERDGITRLVIRNGVTTVGMCAFQHCAALQSVTIPDSVTDIRGLAFWGCESLTSLAIPDGVRRIRTGAFGGCESLTSVDIPDSVTKIEMSAFAGCKSLKSASVPAGTRIGRGAFPHTTRVTVRARTR